MRYDIVFISGTVGTIEIADDEIDALVDAFKTCVAAGRRSSHLFETHGGALLDLVYVSSLLPSLVESGS